MHLWYFFLLLQEADKRPSFSDLVQLLSGLLEQGNYHLSAHEYFVISTLLALYDKPKVFFSILEQVYILRNMVIWGKK